MPATHHTETDTSQISPPIPARRKTKRLRIIDIVIPTETRSTAEIGANLNRIGAAAMSQMGIVLVREIDEMITTCKETKDQAQGNS